MAPQSSNLSHLAQLEGGRAKMGPVQRAGLKEEKSARLGPDSGCLPKEVGKAGQGCGGLVPERRKQYSDSANSLILPLSLERLSPLAPCLCTQESPAQGLLSLLLMHPQPCPERGWTKH